MTMRREAIATSGAPAAIGPYSQAVKANGFVFVSGQIPLDPESGDVVEGDVVAQARRVIQSLRAVLEASGSSVADVVKATIFVRDMGDYPRVNEVWAETFGGNEPPARAVVEVSRLPKDVLIEVEAIGLCRS